MSNLQSKLSAVRFEPVRKHTPHPPGDLMLLFGVLLPAAAIVIEALGHACAQTLFDPMPTYWHVAAVSLVPASNLLVWAHLRSSKPLRAGWLAFANGGAIAIAGFYALLFLPILPIALVAVLVLVGVPPLTPLFSLVCALKLRHALRERHTDQRLGGALLAGLAAGIALLLVLDIPAAATKLGIQWAASGAPSQRERGLTLFADARR
jgi:hypothetical protein